MKTSFTRRRKPEVTHSTFLIKTIRFVLSGEIIALYPEKVTPGLNALGGRNAVSYCYSSTTNIEHWARRRAVD